MSYIIKDLEEAVDVVSDWAVKVILEVTNVLSPDGRPFGYVEQTDEEQLNDYFLLRGNSQAWAEKIGGIAGDITKKLTDSQVPEDDILSIHPMDIAQKWAINYSTEMEAKLEKNSGNVSPIGRTLASNSSQVLSPGVGG